MSYRVYHLAELLPTAVAHLKGEPSTPAPAGGAPLHARIAEAALAPPRSRTEEIRRRDAVRPPDRVH